MTQAVLPDTTLCAIVRDSVEKSTVGGIEKWARWILPHVEEAVIVDTGSIDLTYEALQRLRKDFPHLRIYQRQFDGFASSRNCSLRFVKTKRALVLDDDERIADEDFPILTDFINKNFSVWGFNFNFMQVYPDGDIYRSIINCMNPRIFNIEGVKYGLNGNTRGDEDICEGFGKVLDLPVDIIHYLPSKGAKESKDRSWYDNGHFLKVQPLHSARQYGWKEFNPAVNISPSYLKELERRSRCT